MVALFTISRVLISFSYMFLGTIFFMGYIVLNLGLIESVSRALKEYSKAEWEAVNFLMGLLLAPVSVLSLIVGFLIWYH